MAFPLVLCALFLLDVILWKYPLEILLGIMFSKTRFKLSLSVGKSGTILFIFIHSACIQMSSLSVMGYWSCVLYPISNSPIWCLKHCLGCILSKNSTASKQRLMQSPCSSVSFIHDPRSLADHPTSSRNTTQSHCWMLQCSYKLCSVMPNLNGLLSSGLENGFPFANMVGCAHS